MKKIMSLMLGMSLVLGAATFAFAEDKGTDKKKKSTTKKTTEKKSKSTDKKTKKGKDTK